MPRKAFTLVELLVVIAIIGLLSTVAVVSLNSARANARNTKRVADLKQILTALDIGLNDTGALPDSSDGAGGAGCLSPQCTGEWAGYGTSLTLDDYMDNYMATKPVDPPDATRGLAGYHYWSAFGACWRNGGWVAGSCPTIEYAVEITPSMSSCPLGNYWTNTATRIQCMIEVED